jgi:hypothetical protein
MAKVSLKDIQPRLARKKAKPKPKPYFDTQCITYDTKEEIAFITSLLRVKVITNNRKGISIDLGEERLFLRLNQINQLKLVISLLQSEINVLIDGDIEESNPDNISQIKEHLVELEKQEENDKSRKEKTLEHLMWLRYGNKRPASPEDKKKELEEFNNQIQQVRKAKGLA